MIKARIKLNTGEVVTKTFEDKDALIRLINEGHELITALRTT